MNYREFDTGTEVIPLANKQGPGMAPTYSVQDLTPGVRYGKYLASDLVSFGDTQVQLPMQQLPGTALVWSGAAFVHASRRASAGYEKYLVSYDTGTEIVVEVWDFETPSVQRLRKLSQYLLAPRVEVRRPTSMDVQRSFFDGVVGGAEVLRFNSHQNPVGSSIEEVQTDATSEI